MPTQKSFTEASTLSDLRKSITRKILKKKLFEALENLNNFKNDFPARNNNEEENSFMESYQKAKNMSEAFNNKADIVVDWSNTDLI